VWSWSSINQTANEVERRRMEHKRVRVEIVTRKLSDWQGVQVF
jgi:hypothetical protein